MKESNSLNNKLFWTLIALMLIVVIGLTTSTYMQYRFTDTISVDSTNTTSAMYSVYYGAKSIFTVIGTLF